MTQAEEPPAPTKKRKKAARKMAAARVKDKAAPPPASKSGKNDASTPPGDKSIYEDFDALTEYLTNISGKGQEVVREYFARHAGMKAVAGEAPRDPLNVTESFQETMKSLAADPATVMQRQFQLWSDYAELMATMSRRFAGEEVAPVIEPVAGDKRFSHPAWEENPMLDYVKQSYLVFAHWLEQTIEQLEGMDEHEKAKAEFFTKQFIDAMAPSNFAMLNPEVVEATIASKGENLLKGLENLLEDIDRGHGQLAIRQADLDYFKLGENIATTPGKVIFQNDVMQLIQYEATTDEVAKTPMLIVPPWINKFYILDLQPHNSFIKWLVDQGRTVFVISWVNPGPQLKDKTFEDYIHQGVFAALDAVAMATGEKSVDTIGYCIGGTTLAATLALTGEKGRRKTHQFSNVFHGSGRFFGSGRSPPLC